MFEYKIELGVPKVNFKGMITWILALNCKVIKTRL
jgi:hypothetical protein